MAHLSSFQLNRSTAHALLIRSVERLSGKRIAQLFDQGDRLSKYAVSNGGCYADFSKHLLDDEAKRALFSLAEEAHLKEAIEAMFTGKHINETEGRAVMHTALRAQAPPSFDGQNVQADVNVVKDAMHAFVQKVRSGTHTGYTGKTITDIVNIGIGGSDLGPTMVCQALSQTATLKGHFVSNVDGADLEEVLKNVDPETTLFIVVSKTFTTQETLANAEAARDWVVQKMGHSSAVSHHFAAVSTNLEAVESFGISPANTFGFWDWVGGRYSLWSAVGLSIALTGGWETYTALLDGARRADEHFRTTPFEQNIPVWMALLGVWYRNYLDYRSHAVIPYSHSLRRFPAYLQQADMESNGKHIGRDGLRLKHASGPVVWGEPGTNGQHAFFQLLHQGTDVIPVDFVAFAAPTSTYVDHHKKLLANCFAQGEALMNGRSVEEVAAEMRAAGKSEENIASLAPYRSFEGNRPSTTFLFDRLDAQNLGYLIALYEHKIFVQGVLWNVYSFDQWGVELGKALAGKILSGLDNDTPLTFDESTAALIERIRRSSNS